MTDRNLLLAKIAAAKLHVGAAEAELTQIMREIEPEARARKVTVSEVMQGAFAKLQEAKSSVSKLEELLLSTDD
jgi:hypothetical protein